MTGAAKNGDGLRADKTRAADDDNLLGITHFSSSFGDAQPLALSAKIIKLLR